MSLKPFNGSNFPSIDEVKYLHIVNKKQNCAVYMGVIPAIFLLNPKRINMRSVQVASGYGMIFFRAGAEEEARKISNIFADFECYYSSFLATRLSLPDDAHPGQRACYASPAQSCTEYRIPTGIEPHEGIEYALMHKALKNVALFEHFIPIEFVTNPLRLDIKHIDYKDGVGRIYYRRGHEFSASELKKELRKSTNPFEEEHVHRVGQLLGYQLADIEQFIEYIRERDNFSPCQSC